MEQIHPKERVCLMPQQQRLLRVWLTYGTACQLALSQPEKAASIWRRAASRLVVEAVVINDGHDGDAHFLWQMARRRWMNEIGVDEFDESKVHMWL